MRKSRQAEEGLPSFGTLGHTVPHLCMSVPTQPCTSPWIPPCSRALVWQQAVSTAVAVCSIYIFLPTSEKTSTKWPCSTWLLRGRAGGKPSLCRAHSKAPFDRGLMKGLRVCSGRKQMFKCGKGKWTLRHHVVRKVIRTGLPGLLLLQQCLGTGPGLSQPGSSTWCKTKNKVNPCAKNLAQDTPAAEPHQSHSPPATVSTMSPSG